MLVIRCQCRVQKGNLSVWNVRSYKRTDGGHLLHVKTQVEAVGGCPRAIGEQTHESIFTCHRTELRLPALLYMLPRQHLWPQQPRGVWSDPVFPAVMDDTDWLTVADLNMCLCVHSRAWNYLSNWITVCFCVRFTRCSQNRVNVCVCVCLCVCVCVCVYQRQRE